MSILYAALVMNKRLLLFPSVLIMLLYMYITKKSKLIEMLQSTFHVSIFLCNNSLF